jgi:hypothetical protein
LIVEKWTWLIVPVMMFVLFVLSQIMKRDEDKPRPRRQPQPRRDPAEPQQPQDQRGDLQRFLDEVQRLRERAEQKKQEASSPWAPPRPVQPVIVPEAGQAQRRKPVVKAVKKEEVLEVVPVDTATEQPARILIAASREHARPARPVSPAAKQLLALLRSPSSLATAVLLKEVLDRPLCLRNERRGMMQ